MEDHKIRIFEQQKLVLKDFKKKEEENKKQSWEGRELVGVGIFAEGRWIWYKGVVWYKGMIWYAHKVVFVDESQKECLSKG